MDEAGWGRVVGGALNETHQPEETPAPGAK
jgi:hypothetical protein